MATVPKLASPSPSIFTSDPLEQIYARGQLDPHMAGLASMLLYGAQQDRGDVQDKYMQSLASNNRMESQLQQILGVQDLKKELIGKSADLAGKGFAPSTLSGGPDLFTDIPGGDKAASTITDLRIAQAAAERAKAANAGAGNAPGGKDQVVSTVMPYKDPSGNPVAGPTVMTFKGGTAEQIAQRKQALTAKVIAQTGNANITPAQQAAINDMATRMVENQQHPGINDQ